MKANNMVSPFLYTTWVHIMRIFIFYFYFFEYQPQQWVLEDDFVFDTIWVCTLYIIQELHTDDRLPYGIRI